MADPDLELPDLSPGETGPQSLPLSPSAAEAITSGTPRSAVSTEDKAAIAHLGRPYREATTAQLQPPKQERHAGLDSAIDNRPSKLAPQSIAAKRDHNDLGRPPPDSVQTPHPANIPNIFNSIGEWFSQTNIGSATIQMLGRQAKEQTDGYIFAKQKSQLNEQRIRYNNMVNSNMDTQNQLETELMDYARAMGGDPKTLTQRLLQVARQHGDTNLPFIVTHKGAQAGLDYLTDLDRRYQDLHKANSTLKGVEEEHNADPEGDVPPDKRQDKKPSEDGGPDAGAPSNNPYRTGGPPIEVAPPGDAGAPTQRPSTAPPQPAPEAPGATVVVPGAGAAPSDQGGFAPSIHDAGPQGAAGPLPDTGAPVQVAEAESDLAPSWVSKIPNLAGTEAAQASAAVAAQQPDDNYDHPMPPSAVLRDPKWIKGGAPYRATDLVDQAARNEILNPGSADDLRKNGLATRASLAKRRALEITDYLSSLAADPHPSGPWVVRDIESAVPGLGKTVQQIADGSRPPPTARQQYGRDPYPKLIAMLVGKVDPSMNNPGVYENRNKALRDFGPGGVQGKALMSNITAFQHIDGNVAILKELQGIPGWKDYLARTAQSLPGESVLGPLLRIPGQAGAAALGGEQGQRVQNLLNQYQINLDIAIAEGQRAASGAAPHEAGMDRLLASMDITKNTESGAMAAAQQLTEMLSRRLQVQADTFVTSTGAKPGQNLINYIAKYLPNGGYETLSGRPAAQNMLTPEIRQILSGQGAAATPQSIDDIMRKYGG